MVSSSNAQTTPLARTLNRFAERKVQEALQQIGRGLPASVVSVSGQIVTVKFEVDTKPFTLDNVTCPAATWMYLRMPIQVGEKGMVLSADTFLGGVSGLGEGTPDLSIVGNLSALIFLPVSNKGWDAFENPNAVGILGPDGAIIRSIDKSVTMTLTKEEASVKPAGVQPFIVKGNLVVQGNIQFNGNIEAEDGSVYQGNILTGGEITAKVGAANVSVSTHQHTQGNDSHGDTEVPTNAPIPGT